MSDARVMEGAFEVREGLMACDQRGWLTSRKLQFQE